MHVPKHQQRTSSHQLAQCNGSPWEKLVQRAERAVASPRSELQSLLGALAPSRMLLVTFPAILTLKTSGCCQEANV